MRAAVQGEGRLKSMPNNTVIMMYVLSCELYSRLIFN